MQIKELLSDFDKLQKIHWDKSLDAVYWAGEIKNPKICFVFMNPTAKNVSSSKTWTWLKAPWLGTKNVWKMFYSLWIIDENIYIEIKNKKPQDWDYDFSLNLYRYLKEKSIYITNLAKCTQSDAHSLKDWVFREYLDLFYREIDLLNPELIISFWWQVSSIALWKNIKISEYRKKSEELKINNKTFKVFPCYYPVWQGMRNMKVSREDISWIFDFLEK